MVRKVFLLSLILIGIMSVSAYGSETAVKITKAELKDNVVSMSCTVENPVDSQQLTLMVIGYENGSFDYDDIVYVNQVDYAQNQTLSFSYGSWADTEGIYAIKVGGTNIDTPAWAILNVNKGAVVYGDVDENGLVDAADAVYTLQYVLNSLAVKFSASQFIAADVSGDAVITAYDAACILSKVLNSDYIFAVEE